MGAKFDNLDDVASKFTGTIVYYEGQPVLIKQAMINPEKPGISFLLLAVGFGQRAGKSIDVEDPKLNYRHYSIGYVNNAKSAAWWFRKPHRQYAQGLKANQLGVHVSTPGMIVDEGFNFSKPFVSMLQNIYPDVEYCKKVLLDSQTSAIAFHRDFAISFDKIHDDYILEYHAQKIGVSVNNDLTKFKILPEARHLHEALEEARNVHS